MITPKNIGTTLRAYRKRRGMTLKQVAAASGLSHSFISDNVHGIVPFSIDTLYNVHYTVSYETRNI